MDDIRRILVGDEQYVNLADLIRFCDQMSLNEECEKQICEAMQIISLSLHFCFVSPTPPLTI